MTDDSTVAPPTALARRLTVLLDTVLPPGREKRYSDKEVAAAINARAEARGEGATVTNVYIWQLRTGRRDNPRLEVIRALAEFFDVPPAYFFDTAESAEIERDLLALKGMRDLRVRAVVARLGEMSDAKLSAIRDIVERVYNAPEPDAGRHSTGPAESPS
ncbi:helix-turn-helix domain-containing protein [Virgisporangium aurantiacum]|uniref:XRE family transcriptional regulator n=1 Tax=Virgisporangium aurantiacum TaxID=175570 RepID=A0A8J3ZI97_9ACTN|nr:helix-turn-helix domain-containing protein [Virgisporangium aurantiacum]GIJ62415.1 XRE family transcriptional regulator [Virgisporangium aurantiacum]